MKLLVLGVLFTSVTLCRPWIEKRNVFAERNNKSTSMALYQTKFGADKPTPIEGEHPSV